MELNAHLGGRNLGGTPSFYGHSVTGQLGTSHFEKELHSIFVLQWHWSCAAKPGINLDSLNCGWSTLWMQELACLSCKVRETT